MSETTQPVDNLAWKNTLPPETQDNANKTNKSAPDDKQKRHAEQIEWSRKEVERKTKLAINAYVKLAKEDVQNLIDLHETDPKLANEVAKQFDYDSYEEAIWSVKGTKKTEPKETNNWLSDDEFSKRYKAQRAKEVHAESLEHAGSIIDSSIDDDEIAQSVREKFDELSDWRQLTRKRAEEYARMAILYVTDWKVSAKKKAKLSDDLYSTWLSWRGKKSNKSSNPLDDSPAKGIVITADGKIVSTSNKQQ